MDDFVALCFFWFLIMGVLIVVLSNDAPEQATAASATKNQSRHRST